MSIDCPWSSRPPLPTEPLLSNSISFATAKKVDSLTTVSVTDQIAAQGLGLVEPARVLVADRGQLDVVRPGEREAGAKGWPRFADPSQAGAATGVVQNDQPV